LARCPASRAVVRRRSHSRARESARASAAARAASAARAARAEAPAPAVGVDEGWPPPPLLRGAAAAPALDAVREDVGVRDCCSIAAEEREKQLSLVFGFCVGPMFSARARRGARVIPRVKKGMSNKGSALWPALTIKTGDKGCVGMARAGEEAIPLQPGDVHSADHADGARADDEGLPLLRRPPPAPRPPAPPKFNLL